MAFQVPRSMEQDAGATIEQLFDFLKAQGGTDYMGERVSQLQHSLQAAQLAYESGADDETILAALLHDVGRFIPEASSMPALIAPGGQCVGIKDHEVLGEQYLRQLGFSDKICQLVGSHVMAKRYLIAVDKEYYDSLSSLSKNSLFHQVGEVLGVQERESVCVPVVAKTPTMNRAAYLHQKRSNAHRRILCWRRSWPFVNGTMGRKILPKRPFPWNISYLWPQRALFVHALRRHVTSV